jgi:D-alanyl-D-alanine carboxypeptidase (penicillin-binding protein 5/6)
MKKIVILYFSLLLLSVHGVYAKEDVTLTADYAIAVDVAQDTVLYEKNADKKMYPASMTKIITVIVALDMIEDLDKKVTITDKDLETIFETGASAAYFTVGETVTYKDLIYGAMLPSGADATRALAFNLCGDLEIFVGKMNNLADTLKLKNTNFVNTTGIHDDNHYTTASDLATILRYAMDNPDFVEAFARYTYTTSNGLHNWVNNGMYSATMYDIDSSRIIGCKSGYTEEAERCLASILTIDDRQAITIVGHSERKVLASANIDTNNLAQYCEDSYAEVKLHTSGDVFKNIPVTFGEKENYSVTYTNDVMAYLPINYEDKDIKYTQTIKELDAPIKKGTKIGNINIEYQGKTLYQQDVIVEHAIQKDTIKYTLHTITSLVFPYGLIIVFIIMCILLYRYQLKKKHKNSNR